MVVFLLVVFVADLLREHNIRVAERIVTPRQNDTVTFPRGIGSSGDFIQSNNCGSNLAGFGGMLPCAPWFARRELDCLREIYFHKLGTNLNVMGGIWRTVAM